MGRRRCLRTFRGATENVEVKAMAKKSEAERNLEAMGAISMTRRQFEKLPFKFSEHVRKQQGMSKKQWAAYLEAKRPEIIKKLEELRGSRSSDGVPTEVLFFEGFGLTANMKERGITKAQLKAEMERENGPLGVIDDLFVMLRYFKEGEVEFVWPQVNDALKSSEELCAADPVRWHQFLQECNKIAPGSIPSGMLQ
jgi:hypothetical protein